MMAFTFLGHYKIFKLITDDRFDSLDKILAEKDKLRNQKDDFLQKLIDKSSDVADTNHEQLREVIDLGRREIMDKFEQLRREEAAFRDKLENEKTDRNNKVDKELSSLREGRKTDQGFRTGSARFWDVLITIIIAMIITYLANTLSIGPVGHTTEPQTTQQKAVKATK